MELNDFNDNIDAKTLKEVRLHSVNTNTDEEDELYSGFDRYKHAASSFNDPHNESMSSVGSCKKRQLPIVPVEVIN